MRIYDNNKCNLPTLMRNCKNATCWLIELYANNFATQLPTTNTLRKWKYVKIKINEQNKTRIYEYISTFIAVKLDGWMDKLAELWWRKLWENCCVGHMRICVNVSACTFETANFRNFCAFCLLQRVQNSAKLFIIELWQTVW